MRVVIPYLPLPLESPMHQALADFDWIGAIDMLRTSVAVACGPVPCHVITDREWVLRMPHLRYRTRHRRLMLWTLEACASFLESADFDQDTVMLDADQLVFRNLARWFRPEMDLGICVRTLDPRDPGGFPVLNGVQFWAVHAKDRLGPFYRQALAIAEQLPEASIVWGADTLALQQLVQPYAIEDTVARAGLRVRMIGAVRLIERCTRTQIDAIAAGQTPLPLADVVDFRSYRKPYMRPFYAATVGRMVPA